jgi:hypothetical protein
LSKRIVPEKRLGYYLPWITQFFAFCDKSLCDDVSHEEIDSFLSLKKAPRQPNGVICAAGVQFMPFIPQDGS